LLYPFYRFYQWRLEANVKKGPLPNHIGLILDGNRRYGRFLGLSKIKAHASGADKLEEVLDWCQKLGIKIVTVYAFSAENVKRSDVEVKELMGMFEEKFREVPQDERVHREKVRVRAIGKTEMLPENVREAIAVAEKATEDYTDYQLNIAVGYGGRMEIVEACRKIATKVGVGQLTPADVDEEMIRSHLYTNGIPDPDLIVRTSGEERLSGFLLWQSAYSELYFCESYWPEFREIDFLRAVRTFQQRERRFGT
jgi:tritrans,polycis-undecaprenyl-diphosphate synthase [geranylgeranyl-diphosphate specific]